MKDYSCYGSWQAGKSTCNECEYLHSCRYYKESAAQMGSGHRDTSFEQVSDFLTALPNPPASPPSEKLNLIKALAIFFRYLLKLDDITLSMIREVVLNAAAGKRLTVAELGKLHGCSRQAVHRKILTVIAAYPELAALFMDTMVKLSRSRRNFLMRKISGTMA